MSSSRHTVEFLWKPGNMAQAESAFGRLGVSAANSLRRGAASPVSSIRMPNITGGNASAVVNAHDRTLQQSGRVFHQYVMGWVADSKLLETSTRNLGTRGIAAAGGIAGRYRSYGTRVDQNTGRAVVSREDYRPVYGQTSIGKYKTRPVDVDRVMAAEMAMLPLEQKLERLSLARQINTDRYTSALKTAGLYQKEIDESLYKARQRQTELTSGENITSKTFKRGPRKGETISWLRVTPQEYFKLENLRDPDNVTKKMFPDTAEMDRLVQTNYKKPVPRIQTALRMIRKLDPLDAEVKSLETASADLSTFKSDLEKQSKRNEGRLNRYEQELMASSSGLTRNLRRAYLSTPPIPADLDKLLQSSPDLQKDLRKQVGIRAPYVAPAAPGTPDADRRRIDTQRLTYSRELLGRGISADTVKVTKDLETGLRRVNIQMVDAEGYATDYNKALDKHNKIADDTDGRYRKHNDFLKQSVYNLRKVAEWTVATTVVIGGLGLAMSSFQRINQINSDLTRFALTAQVTASEANNMFNAISQIAYETATPLQELTAVMDDIALATRRAGQSAKEWQDSMKSLATSVGIFTNLTGVDTARATDLLSAAYKQLQIQPEQITGVLSKVSAVAGGNAQAIEDIVQALGSVSEAAKAAGLDLDQQIASVQVLSQVTNKSAADVATSFKNLFGAISSPGSVKILEKFDIEVRNSEGELRDFLDIYKDIYDAVQSGKIAPGKLQDVLRGISGGPRRAPDAAALLEAMPLIYEQYAKSLNATNEALIANERVLGTNSAKMEQLRTQFQTTLINQFTEAINSLVKGLLDVGKILNGIFGDVALGGLTKMALQLGIVLTTVMLLRKVLSPIKYIFEDIVAGFKGAGGSGGLLSGLAAMRPSFGMPSKPTFSRPTVSTSFPSRAAWSAAAFSPSSWYNSVSLPFRTPKLPSIEQTFGRFSRPTISRPSLPSLGSPNLGWNVASGLLAASSRVKVPTITKPTLPTISRPTIPPIGDTRVKAQLNTSLGLGAVGTAGRIRSTQLMTGGYLWKFEDKLWDKAASTYKEIRTKLTAAFESLRTSITSQLQTIGNFATKITTGGYLWRFEDRLWASSIATYKDARTKMGKAFEGLKTGVNARIQPIKNFVTQVTTGGYLWAFEDRLWATAAATFKNVQTKLTTSFKGISLSIGSRIQKMRDFATKLTTGGYLWKFEDALWAKAPGQIAALKANIATSLTNLNKSFIKLWENAGKAIEGTMLAIQKSLLTVNTYLTQAWIGTGALMSKSLTGVGNMGEKLGTTLATGLIAAQVGLLKAGNNLKTSVTKIRTNLASTAKNIATAAASIPGRLQALGSLLAQSFQHILTSLTAVLASIKTMSAGSLRGLMGSKMLPKAALAIGATAAGIGAVSAIGNADTDTKSTIASVGQGIGFAGLLIPNPVVMAASAAILGLSTAFSLVVEEEKKLIEKQKELKFSIYDITRALKEQSLSLVETESAIKDAVKVREDYKEIKKPTKDETESYNQATKSFIDNTLKAAEINITQSSLIDDLILKLPQLGEQYKEVFALIKGGSITDRTVLNDLSKKLSADILGIKAINLSFDNPKNRFINYGQPQPIDSSEFIDWGDADLPQTVINTNNPPPAMSSSELTKKFAESGIDGLKLAMSVLNTPQAISPGGIEINKQIIDLLQLNLATADETQAQTDEYIQAMERLIEILNKVYSPEAATSNRITTMGAQIEAAGSLGIISGKDAANAYGRKALAEELQKRLPTARKYDQTGPAAGPTAGQDLGVTTQRIDSFLFGTNGSGGFLGGAAGANVKSMGKQEALDYFKILTDVDPILKSLTKDTEVFNASTYAYFKQRGIEVEGLEVDISKAIDLYADLRTSMDEASVSARQGLFDELVSLRGQKLGGEFDENMEDYNLQTSQIRALIRAWRELTPAMEAAVNNQPAIKAALGNITSLVGIQTRNFEELIPTILNYAKTLGLSGPQIDKLKKKLIDLVKTTMLLDNLEATIRIKVDVWGQDIPPNGAQRAAIKEQVSLQQKMANIGRVIDNLFSRGSGSAFASTDTGGGGGGNKRTIGNIDLPESWRDQERTIQSMVKEAVKWAQQYQSKIPGEDKEHRKDLVAVMIGNTRVLLQRGIAEEYLRKGIERLTDQIEKQNELLAKADTIRRIRVGAGDFSAIANVPVNTKSGISLAGENAINITLNLNGTVLTPAQLEGFANMVAAALKRQIAK